MRLHPVPVVSLRPGGEMLDLSDPPSSSTNDRPVDTGRGLQGKQKKKTGRRGSGERARLRPGAGRVTHFHLFSVHSPFLSRDEVYSGSHPRRSGGLRTVGTKTLAGFRTDVTPHQGHP